VQQAPQGSYLYFGTVSGLKGSPPMSGEELRAPEGLLRPARSEKIVTFLEPSYNTAREE